MRKIILIVIFSLLLLWPMTSLTEAQVGIPRNQIVDMKEKPVKLTDKQKEELKSLNQEVLDKRKEVIQKYVEYGMISKERGNIIISNMEQRHKELEENDFIYPQSSKYKHKSCR